MFIVFYCLPLPVFFFVCFLFAWCVLLIQNNKKLTKKQKGPCYRVLWYFLHIFIETLTGVWTDGLHPNCNIPVTNRQTERLYWRAVFIMKQYWDQIETVVTWWLIPPLRSPPPPPGPDTPLHSSSLLRCLQVDPFSRTASKSSGYRLLPSCPPMSRVLPSVIGRPEYVAHICVNF